MRKVYWVVGVLALLIATALRTWQLSSLPPGPHFDEAVNLIMARSIAFGGATPFPIFDSFQGREVLYYYLNAPLLHLIGDNIFTLRLVSMYSNLIAIAASITLGRAMFTGRRGIIIGLTAGILMTLSFPQILLSRQAFRAITLPMIQALALMLLWRGLNARRHNVSQLVIAGFIAGLAIYTYMASRLFPMWLALAGVTLLWIDWQHVGKRMRQGALFFGMMALVIAPMAVFALQNPDTFLDRLEEVTIDPGTSSGSQQVIDTIQAQLVDSIKLHLRMFFVDGEDYLRYNIPGRSYLTGPEGLLMLAGIVVALRRLFHAGRPHERTAYALVLLSPLMVIPSVIAVNGLPPNHMRSIAMTPLIFLLVAIGFEALFERVTRRMTEVSIQRSYAAISTAILLVGGLLVANVYFDWANRADLFYETDADLAAAATWLLEQPDEGTLIYVAARDRAHPTMTIANIPPITWLGTDTLFSPPDGRDGLYIFPRSAPPPSDWRVWLEPGTIDDLPQGPDKRAAFEAFRLSADFSLPTSYAMPPALVRNLMMTLSAIDSPVMLPSGRGTIATAWHIDRTPPVDDLFPILHVEDTLGNIIARGEAFLTHTNEWRPGETLFQRIDVQIPVGTPPGMYPLSMAWVSRNSGDHTPYLNDDDSQGGVWATVGMLEVVRPNAFPSPDELPIAVREDIDVAAGIRLLGWTPPATSIRPGESLAMTLFWQGTATDDTRAAVIYEALLLNGDQQIQLWEGQPVMGQHASDQWLTGELVTGHVRWQIPPELDGRTYTLAIRIGALTIDLTNIEITGLSRRFDAPQTSHVESLDFGDTIQLYGFNISINDADINLDLIWQAKESIDTDFTVFVHVVDQLGEIIVQRDVKPVDNTYPMTLWAAGEYIVDTHHITVSQPQMYTLRFGLYDPADGTRLAPRFADSSTTDFVEIGLMHIASE